MPTSLEHAQEIATHLTENLLGEKLSEIALIEGRGEVNQVYKLTAGDKRVVLRIHDRAEYPRYQKEQWCANTAREKGVPTPQAFQVGEDEECAYMLLEFLEGNNGTDITDTNDTWYALGKSLREIHNVPVHGFGDTLTDITSGTNTQWGTYLQNNIQALGGESSLVKNDILT